MAREENEEVLRLFGGFAFPENIGREREERRKKAKPLAIKVLPLIPEEERPESREEKEEWIFEKGWDRLYDLLTREWPQIESLKEREERLRTLADNEGLMRLKTLYDEQEERFRLLIIEYWDQLLQIISQPPAVIEYITNIMIPIFRRMFPTVPEEIRIDMPTIVRETVVSDPRVAEELQRILLENVEWMRRVVQAITQDFARMVIQTYPNWRDGVFDQVLTDIIENW